MRITYRDVVATLLVAGVVVPYLGYLGWGRVPLLQDPRGMGAVGLVLGLFVVSLVLTWALGEYATRPSANQVQEER
jgi:hypothetical protein